MVGVGAQGLALHVVDRVLAAEHEHEEQLGEAMAQLGDAGRPEAHVPAQAGQVDPAAVDELLEHHPVVRLLDDLVVGVAEGRVAVVETEGVLEQPALEDVLELEADLHGADVAVQADARAHAGGLGLVPVGRTEGVVGRQLEARIVRVDGVGRVVPRDVGVRVVVLLDGLAAEPLDQPGEGVVGHAVGDELVVDGPVGCRAGGSFGDRHGSSWGDAVGSSRAASLSRASTRWASASAPGMPVIRVMARPSSTANRNAGTAG